MSTQAKAAMAAVIAVAGLLAFSGAFSNGWTNFDDLWQAKANPLVNPPFTAAKFVSLFVPYHGEYQPVKLLSFFLDRLVSSAIGCDFVFVLHATNVIIHILNAVLVALIAAAVAQDLGAQSLKSEGIPFVALFAGIYFVVHPIHVESVAWISGRKDLLSFLFAALSFLYFRRATLPAPRRAGLLAVVFLVLALGSKSTVVSFPLIALTYWALVAWRGGARVMWPLAGLLCASLAFAVFSLYLLASGGYQAGPAGGSFWVNLLTVVKNFPFYMRRMLFPTGLSAVYSVEAAGGVLDPGVLWGAFVIVAQVSVVILVRAAMVRFIVLWYLLSLLPVLQILPTSVPSMIADRYAYIPSVPFAVAPAVILWQVRRALAERGAVAVSSLLVAAGVFYAGVLGVAAWSATRVWKSSETLWSNVLAHNPSERHALVNLGQYYLEAGQLERAGELFERTIAVDPGFLLAYNNMGLVYEKEGRLIKAWEAFLAGYTKPSSLVLKSTRDARAKAAYGLARVALAQGRFLAATRYAEDACMLDSTLKGPLRVYEEADRAIKEARILADDLLAQGDSVAAKSPAKAVEIYRKAIDLAPEYEAPYIRLARLFAAAGEYQKACDYYAMASLHGRPSAEFEYEYGVAAIRAGEYAVAADRLSKALTLDPSMEKARVKLALAKAYGGEPAQALLMLEQVLAANPSNEEARENRDAIKSFVEARLKEHFVAPK